MSPNALTRRKDAEFSTKIDALRGTLAAMLREADIRAFPTEIDPEKGIDFYDNVAKFERRLIELALGMTGGRQNRAAKLLRMRESTLSWKIKKLNIIWRVE